MPYDYVTQTFKYFDSRGRKRPVRVTGFVPIFPTRSPTREEVLPLALYEKNMIGFPDIAPHNTVRGHLLGLDSLGGHEEHQNLVPMYGQFNLSTYKTKFENVLKAQVQRNGVKSGELDMTIRYDDAKGDPRVPTGFTYALTVTYNDNSTEVFADNIAHPAPEAAYEPPMRGFRKYITDMQRRMERSKWWVEDHVVNREGSRLHDEHGQPLIVPERDYSQRPYAVVDYILYGLKTENKYFGFICAPELYNGGGWSGWQIKLILAVNLAFNNGYYKSDDPMDYVYRGNSRHFKNEEQVDWYYLHSHASSGQRDGVLIMEGYHQKPEIDHIIIKGKHLNPGCNAYSNARVISRFLNSEDRGKYS